jgi:hypothetical protein
MYVQKKQGSGLQVALWVFAIVGAVVVLGGFKIGWPMYLERRAEGELAKVPAYQQIAKWEPETYARMKKEMIASLQRRESPAQAQGRVRVLVTGLAKKYMKSAADDVLVDYLKVTMDEIRQMAARDPGIAYDMLFGGRQDVDMTQYLDPATQKHDMDTLAEIIHSGVAKEAGYQDDQRARQLLRQVVAGMRNDFGKDAELPFNPKGAPPDGSQYRFNGGLEAYAAAMAAYQNKQVDKKRTVEMTLEFYNRVLSLRSDQAAKVMRLLLSKA